MYIQPSIAILNESPGKLVITNLDDKHMDIIIINTYVCSYSAFKA